jgi:uncharacterized Zn finger protein
MKSVLDNDTIEVPCPNCGHKLKERIAKLKTNPKLTCRSCSTAFVVDAKQLKVATEKVDKALADLQRKIGRAFK